MTTRPSTLTRATARAIALAVVILVGLAAACSVDVDVANKACPCGDGYVCDDSRQVCVLPQDLVAQPPPACDPCTCSVDADCKDPSRSRCSPAKVCVECSKTPTDTCSVGYCNDQFQCTFGCKGEADCQKISQGTHCQLQSHQCVECVTGMFPCKDAGKTCSPSGVCVESCSASKLCPNGKQCCQGLCLDTQSDVLNCGVCDFTCSKVNGTPACTGSACKWTCASGFAHCGTANSGCETNIRTDVTNCGGCGKNCNAAVNANGVACVAAACTYSTCKPGFGDCDGQKANGCECACGAKGQRCCPSGPACLDGSGCNGASGKC